MFFQASNKCQLRAKPHDRCEGYSRGKQQGRSQMSLPLKNKQQQQQKVEETVSNEQRKDAQTVLCPGFPSVPGACQALSKFRTLAHTIPLA